MKTLTTQDLDLASIIEHEEERQRAGITLIASENFAYPEVHEIMGSVLSNKYAEGYPGNALLCWL